ncbi:MAG: hypothetical protein J6O04_12430 [Selenomonadaceae bacterium]|nr:hypothetical protein [Selenomonadaceae bacterium]
MKIIGDKKVICFGAGLSGITMCDSIPKLTEYISFFTDNDENKWGKSVSLQGKCFKIVSLNKVVKNIDHDNYCILITSRFWDEIVKQLFEFPQLDNVDCYICLLMENDSETLVIKSYGKEHIPRVIHYFWMGGNPLPELARKCIDSWKRFCPDYEIICWNESNYDIEKIPLLKQATKEECWNIISDYGRMDVLYNQGGIYLDVDVEIVKSFDDLLKQEAYMGFDSSYMVNTGHGFGAVKGNGLIKECKEIYEAVKENDNIEWRKFYSPILTSNVLCRHGLNKNNRLQTIKNVTIFPNDYFDPILQLPRKSTYSVHHYGSTWSIKEDMQGIWKNQQDYYRRLNKDGLITWVD